MHLNKYPSYKDSGSPWLGVVPKHWAVRPAFGAYSPILERNKGMKEKTVLSLSYGRIIVKPAEKLHGLVPESFETYQIVNPGDIVLRTTDLQNDHTSLRVGMVRDRGIITSAYLALRANAGFNSDFAYQFLNVWDMSKAIYGYGSGLRQNLDFVHFKRMPVAIPSPDEQSAIVKFLDHYDRKIKRYIKAKLKLVKLLEEQKQSIIHRAATGQIDVRTGKPYANYKPSGVEWLGNVPEHWDVMPLRRVTIARCDGPFGSGLKSLHYTNDGVRVIRLQNIGHATFRDSDAAFIAPEYYATLGDHSVEAGDVLIAGLGDERHPAGRACVAPVSIVPAMVKADCFRFRLNSRRVNFDFVALHLTATAVAASAVLSTGATRQRINLQSTTARAICVPPPCEQDKIVTAISNDTMMLNATTDRANQEISLLREYRTRLIADVVTGKLDVREAAKNLSDEPTEPEETIDEELSPDEEPEEQPGETTEEEA